MDIKKKKMGQLDFSNDKYDHAIETTWTRGNKGSVPPFKVSYHNETPAITN